ncbi:MAG: replication initiation protein [Bacteroidota bacterium]
MKKHPIQYTVFQPNVLIGANSDMKLMELRLYTELLSFKHSEEPERLLYNIPYSAVTESDGRQADKNLSRDYMRLTKAFQKRVFDLDREFMQEHFGEKYPVSIVPFPRIRYEEKMFEISIEPYFKQILVKLELGFTKGDIQILRSFKHTYSHRLYWIIRQNQWRKNTLTLELEELKSLLGCSGKYPRYNNFRKDVIEPVKSEFQGTWVEFDYEPVRKGRGGAVKAITFIFKDDMELSKALKLGEVYSFEKVLASYQLHEREIKKIRVKVTLEEELQDGLCWTERYVNTVIELVKKTYQVKRKKSATAPIRKMGPYILKVLNEGWYIDKVKDRWIEEDKNQRKQLDIFESAEVVEEEPKAYRSPYRSFKEMYQLHLEVHGEDITEAEYADRLGYKIQGEWVVKVG